MMKNDMKTIAFVDDDYGEHQQLKFCCFGC
jgi:hypothetical protein